MQQLRDIAAVSEEAHRLCCAGLRGELSAARFLPTNSRQQQHGGEAPTAKLSDGSNQLTLIFVAVQLGDAKHGKIVWGQAQFASQPLAFSVLQGRVQRQVDADPRDVNRSAAHRKSRRLSFILPIDRDKNIGPPGQESL
ncbi:hypothetical protein D3C74_228890 [compost metagenome]